MEGLGREVESLVGRLERRGEAERAAGLEVLRAAVEGAERSLRQSRLLRALGEEELAGSAWLADDPADFPATDDQLPRDFLHQGSADLLTNLLFQSLTDQESLPLLPSTSALSPAPQRSVPQPSNLPPPLPEPLLQPAQKKHGCRDCGMTFAWRRRLAWHRKVHLRAPFRFACALCGAFLPSRPGYRRHLHRRHGRPLPQAVRARRALPSERREQPSEKVESAERGGGRKLFRCSACPFASVHRQSVHRHAKRCARRPDGTGQKDPCPSAPAKQLCGDCGAALSSSWALREHRAYAHSSAKAVVCDACGAAFRLAKDLRKHRRFVHRPEKPLPCPHCPKAFKTRQHLSRHRKALHPTSEI